MVPLIIPIPGKARWPPSAAITPSADISPT
jgi:hypothetical protein